MPDVNDDKPPKSQPSPPGLRFKITSGYPKRCSETQEKFSYIPKPESTQAKSDSTLRLATNNSSEPDAPRNNNNNNNNKNNNTTTTTKYSVKSCQSAQTDYNIRNSFAADQAANPSEMRKVLQAKWTGPGERPPIDLSGKEHPACRSPKTQSTPDEKNPRSKQREEFADAVATIDYMYSSFDLDDDDIDYYEEYSPMTVVPESPFILHGEKPKKRRNGDIICPLTGRVIFKGDKVSGNRQGYCDS